MAKAGSIVIDISAGTAKFIADLEAANGQLRKFGQGAKDAGSHTVTSMQASSAAIRLLENPMGNNIRAVERFITLIPGIGNALKVAFPLVGALAFIDILAKMGGEAQKFIQGLQQAPERISGAFRELNAPLRQTNDELALANDRLRNEIASLEGKPQNGLALALDEARVAADKLAASIDKDLAELNKLLKTEEIGLFKSLVSGVRTDDLRKQLGGDTGHGGFAGRVDAINDEKSARLAGAKTIKDRDAIEAEFNARLTKAYDDEIKALQGRLSDAQAAQRAHEADTSNKFSLRYRSQDQTINIEETQGALRDLQAQRNLIGLTSANEALQSQKTQLEASKANSEKEAQALKAGYDRMLANAEQFEQLLASERLAFRQQELAEVIAGYGTRNAAIKKLEDELRTEIGHLQQETFREAKEARDKDEKDELRYQEDLTRFAVQMARERNESVARAGKSLSANTDQFGNELPDITKLPAAVRLAGTPLGDRLAAANAGYKTGQQQQV